ncbi:MAG: hypothetical protein V1834_00475, partial [Candidatus Micrarchaeota archaeon]
MLKTIAIGVLAVLLLGAVGLLLIGNTGPIIPPKILVVGVEPQGFAELMQTEEMLGYEYLGAVSDQQLDADKFAEADVVVLYGQRGCGNLLALLENATVKDEESGKPYLEKGISFLAVGDACFDFHSEFASALGEFEAAEELSLGEAVPEAVQTRARFVKQKTNAPEFANVSSFDFNGPVFEFDSLPGDVLASFEGEDFAKPAVVKKNWMFKGYYFAYSPFNSLLNQES